MAQGVKAFYNVEFKVTGAGQVSAKVEGVTKGFEKLDAAMEKTKKHNKSLERELIGTTKYYDKQIKKIEEWRATYANTKKEYDKASVAIDKLKASRDKLTGAEAKAQAPMKGTLAAFRQQIAVLRSQQQTLAKNKQEYQEFENKIKSVRANMEALTGTVRMSKKPNQDMISNAGLAGATLTELGRTISDSNYGIKGMANNLSQLSTLFITLVSKTEGGMIPALKGLWKQLNGPLGIVLAFQIAIAMMEKFAIAQDKAKKEAEKYSEELAVQITLLNEYLNILQMTNGNEEERINTLKALKQIDKELYDALMGSLSDEQQFNDIISERRKLTEALTEAEEHSKEVGKKLIVNRAEQEKLERKIAGLRAMLGNATQLEINGNQALLDAQLRLSASIRDLNDLREKSRELSEKAKVAQENLTVAQENYNVQLEKTKQLTTEYNENYKDSITDLLQTQIDYEESITGGTEKEQIKRAKKVEKLQKKLLDQQKKLALKEAEQRGASIFEISNIEKKYQLERLMLEGETNEKIADIREEFKRTLEKVETIDVDSKKTSGEEAEAGRKLINRVFGKGALESAEKQLQNIAKGNVDEFISTYDKGDDKDKDKEDKEKERKKKEAVKQVRETLNMIEQTSQAFFDAEISREERKTAILNNQLKERLNNEKLTAEQRQAINDQIAANDAELQKKRDKVAEKAFKVQKALNIANTLVDTYRNGWLAYGSQLQIGDPLSPARARIAQGLTIAAGLAQVAAIASQKFVPSGTTVRGGSAGSTGAAIQPPDFNIVGASQQNLLASAVSSKLSQPVKAYVVSKDITTAQEMDRNTVSSATL